MTEWEWIHVTFPTDNIVYEQLRYCAGLLRVYEDGG